MSSRQAERAEARARREAAQREAEARERRRRRLWQLGAVVAAAAAVVVVAIVVSSGGGGGGSKKLKAGRPPQSAQVAALLRGIPQHGITLGSPRAPLTMVEFADLKCPICRAYSEAALPVLIRRYVRPGKLKIEFQPQTFVGSPPGDSERAARFALAAAAQDKMWQFSELWYANQLDESTAYATDSFIRQIASGVPGLDAQRALADRSSSSVDGQLQRASTLFQNAGFTGTPSFLLGGRGQPLRPLAATVDPGQFTGPIGRLLKR
jgi:protein-disulfide isomerase